MYNKLFSKIVTSSVWLSPSDHRIVWITFIALMDQDGYVPFASAANVAHTARVPIEAAMEALKAFESPDPLDPDQEFQGRRIERVANGWVVLNRKKYQEIAAGDKIREQNRLRNQAYRQRKRDARDTHRDVHMTSRDARNVRMTQNDTSGSGSESETPPTPSNVTSRASPPRPPAPDSGNERVLKYPIPDEEWQPWWLAARNRYPVGTYRQADWLEAEREARYCVTEGLCSTMHWDDAIDHFREQHAARRSSSQYVPSPKKFFHRESRTWMEPFPLPEAPANAQEAAKQREEAATQARWDEVRRKASICGFRAPGSVEPLAAYETALRIFERENVPGKPSNGLFHPKS